MISYGRALTETAARHPDAVAFVHGDASTDFATLEAGANRRARAFAASGVGEGDFVTLALPNGLEFVESLFACWKLGATPQPVSARLPHEERQAIIELVDPKLLVGVAPGTHGDRPTQPAGIDCAGESSDPLPDVVSRYRMAICSGGSTGRPKVVVDHIPGQIDPEAPFQGQPPGTSILVPGPLYHSGPLINCLSVLLGGGKVVVMSRFDAQEALDLIAEHRLALAIFVPTMLLRIWKLPEAAREAADLSSLERVVSSSASLPDWLQREWIEWIGPERVWEAYGGSERIGGTLISGTEWLEKPGSVGRATEGRAVRILDPDFTELGPGEIGDIYFLPPGGPGSTYHYLGAEPRRTPDGWETLGDIGYLDDDGYLFLVDRRTDLVITGGSNVYPAEVEGAIEAHPSVRSCAVIGMPDEDLGATVHAIVDAPGGVDESTLRAHLEDRLVRYKVPRSFEFVDELLKDDAGKVPAGRARGREGEGTPGGGAGEGGGSAPRAVSKYSLSSAIRPSRTVMRIVIAVAIGLAVRTPRDSISSATRFPSAIIDRISKWTLAERPRNAPSISRETGCHPAKGPSPRTQVASSVYVAGAGRVTGIMVERGGGGGRVPDRRRPGAVLDRRRDRGVRADGRFRRLVARVAHAGAEAAARVLEDPGVVDGALGRIEVRILPSRAELTFARSRDLAGRRVDARAVVLPPGDVRDLLMKRAVGIGPALHDLDPLQQVAGMLCRAGVLHGGHDEDGGRVRGRALRQLTTHRYAARVAESREVGASARGFGIVPTAEERGRSCVNRSWRRPRRRSASKMASRVFSSAQTAASPPRLYPGPGTAESKVSVSHSSVGPGVPVWMSVAPMMPKA